MRNHFHGPLKNKLIAFSKFNKFLIKNPSTRLLKSIFKCVNNHPRENIVTTQLKNAPPAKTNRKFNINVTAS